MLKVAKIPWRGQANGPASTTSGDLLEMQNT